MKLNELKDGMVLEFEDGNTSVIYNNVSRYAYFDKSPNKSYSNLESSNISCLEVDVEGEIVGDLIRISYMGEVLWERKQCLSLQEAVSSGKKFTHKDCKRFTYQLSDIVDQLEDVAEGKTLPSCINIAEWILGEMQKKAWEIEE